MAGIVRDVVAELIAATNHFDTFHSAHEGYAVILEEVDELWEEVKRWKGHTLPEMDKEAKQIAAMAMRFMYDITRDHQ